MTTQTARRRPMVHPRDDVLAVIDDPVRADAAAAALRETGFGDGDIHIFRGRDDIAGLARAWWKGSGVPAFLAPLVAAALSDERDVEEIYESEGYAGHTVLAVHCRNEDDVRRAVRVLRESGGHDAWYFGRWTMEPLIPTGRHAR